MNLLYDITFPWLPLSSTEAFFCDWKERKNARRVVVVVLWIGVCVCVWGRGRGISRVAFSSPLLALPILPLTLFLFCSMVSLLKTVNFSLTWPASMLIYWNKRKYLQEKRVQLPEDLLATPTWPPLRHVKTLYSKFDLPWPFLYPEIHNTTQHMHFIRWHI